MKILPFDQYITESFDTRPASWTWVNKNVEHKRKTERDPNPKPFLKEGKIKFKIDGNLYGASAFNNYFDDTTAATYISFYLFKGDYKDDMMTGTGNQYVVLATVMAWIRELIDTYSNTKYAIGAEKPTGLGVAKAAGVSKARERVYKRLIDRYVRKLPGKWSVKKEIDDGVAWFLLSRNGE